MSKVPGKAFGSRLDPLDREKMLNITKNVSRLVIGTAQRIDTKLMHPSEMFRQNLLAEFYFIKDFNLLIHELKRRKILVWGLW